MIKWYIGIEAISHRRSSAVLADGDQRVIAYVPNFEAMSLHVTPKSQLDYTLRHIVQELLRLAGLKRPSLKDASLCIGLMGTTFRYERLFALPKLLNDAGVRTPRQICTGDAEIIFAAQGLEHGLLVLSSCGSTAYAYHERKHYRVGGWGPEIDDGGSAYWLGREALRAIARDHDYSNGVNTKRLWACIDAFLMSDATVSKPLEYVQSSWRRLRTEFLGNNLDTRTAIFQLSHNISRHGGGHGIESTSELTRAFVSGLSIPLIQAAADGESLARGIVDKGVDLLISDMDKAMEVSGLKKTLGEIPVVLAGGVFRNNSYYRERFKLRLGDYCDRFNCKIVPNSALIQPVFGALGFAIGNSQTPREENQAGLTPVSKEVITNLIGLAETNGQ